MALSVTNGQTIHMDSTPTLLEFPSGYNSSIHLIKSDKGIVIYEAQLKKHRQLVEISKILDNTELSLANHNIQVLANKSDLYMNHDFKIIGDYEYYQSQEKYTHSECEIHCASCQAELPSNIDHFNHRIQAFTSPVWVQCETVVDKNNVYTVFFGSVQIFPTNELTNGSVSIWSQNNNHMERIGNIEKFYSHYYNSQRKKYWQTSAYKLLCVLGQNNIKLVIPQPTTVLRCSTCQTYCACVKNLSQSRRIFHEYSTSRLQLRIQQNTFHIGIEPIRYETGNVFKIINPALRNENEWVINKSPQTFELQDIKELSIATTGKTDRLALGPVITFTMKYFGIPLLKKGFLHMLKSQSQRFNRTVSRIYKSHSTELPNEVQLVGLQSVADTFRLKLQFPTVHSYQWKDQEDIVSSAIILKNLTIVNAEYDKFVKNHAVDTLMELAIKDINCDIDLSIPVQINIRKHKSFIIYTFGFTCIIAPTVTRYNMISLPHLRMDNTLNAAQVPSTFSVSSFRYDFEIRHEDTAGMRRCLNGILTKKVPSDCGLVNFSQQPIQIVMKTTHFNLIYVSSEKTQGHIQVQCPLLAMVTFDLDKKVGLLLISPRCAVGLHTDTGIITLEGNQTHHGHIQPPKLLVTYQIATARPTSFYNTIIISVVGSVVLCLILGIGVAYYWICVKNVQRIVVNDNDTDSEATIMGLNFAQGRHVHFQGPSTL